MYQDTTVGIGNIACIESLEEYTENISNGEDF